MATRLAYEHFGIPTPAKKGEEQALFE